MDYYFSGQRVPTEGLVEQCRRCVWYAVGISRKKSKSICLGVSCSPMDVVMASAS